MIYLIFYTLRCIMIFLPGPTLAYTRRGIILECHSVFPLVRIRSTHPLPHKRVCSPHPEPKGGNTRLRVRGWANPIRTTGEKAWYSVYSVPTVYEFGQDLRVLNGFPSPSEPQDDFEVNRFRKSIRVSSFFSSHLIKF